MAVRIAVHRGAFMTTYLHIIQNRPHAKHANPSEIDPSDHTCLTICLEIIRRRVAVIIDAATKAGESLYTCRFRDQLLGQSKRALRLLAIGFWRIVHAVVLDSVATMPPPVQIGVHLCVVPVVLSQLPETIVCGTDRWLRH